MSNGSRVSDLFDLRGAVAVVTGASSGLGEGFARTLVDAGATVVAAARRLDRLEVLAKELDGTGPSGGMVVPVACDVTSPDDRRRLVETAARISRPHRRTRQQRGHAWTSER